MRSAMAATSIWLRIKRPERLADMSAHPLPEMAFGVARRGTCYRRSSTWKIAPNEALIKGGSVKRMYRPKSSSWHFSTTFKHINHAWAACQSTRLSTLRRKRNHECAICPGEIPRSACAYRSETFNSLSELICHKCYKLKTYWKKREDLTNAYLALRAVNPAKAGIVFPVQHRKHEKSYQEHKCFDCNEDPAAGKELKFEPDKKWRCSTCRIRFRRKPLECAIHAPPILADSRNCANCGSPERDERRRHSAQLRCVNCAGYFRTHKAERPRKEWKDQPEACCGNPECGNIVGSPLGGMSVGTWFAATTEDGTRRCHRCSVFWNRQLAAQEKHGNPPRERPRSLMREQGVTG
ncbi:hypothetical protein BJ166DRAFT_511179 [Pestalotiopsis sp. NC0098]|nr:hypothetical protein BJ166DRAFT_511179 [Pestalotiopsis sp. NC0098]